MSWPDGTTLLHGLEDAITRPGPGTVYSYDRILEILVADGLSWDEAAEHFDFNVWGSRGCYPDVVFEGYDDDDGEGDE